MRTVVRIVIRIVGTGVLLAVVALAGYIAFVLRLSKRARETGWPVPSSVRITPMAAKAVTTPKEQRQPQPATAPIRVLVAEDHAVVREGIRMILTATDEFTVVGEAGDGETAIRLTQALRPDVVVMDISMPRRKGLIDA